MPYRIAAIDVHKMVLMVVVASAAEEVKDPTGEALGFECRRFGALETDRCELVEWLQAREVREIVMESTAQYWKPVWMDLEGKFGKLHLARAQSNRAPRGRKNDFRDAKRLARRLLANELMLSFVPEPEQRTWRELARTKDHYVGERARLQNRVEGLLEEMRIKLSGVISDLFGPSGRRILTALSGGKTDPVELAELGHASLQCGRAKLVDALRGKPAPAQLEILKLHLRLLREFDEIIQKLD